MSVAFGCFAGQLGFPATLGASVVLIWLASRSRWLVAAFLAAGIVAGNGSVTRAPEPMDARGGSVELLATMESDPTRRFDGWAFVASVVVDGVTRRVGVETETLPAGQVGDTLRVRGRIRGADARLHRNQVTAWLAADETEVVGGARGAMAVANQVRNRVGNLYDTSPNGALMRGFLIGDTRAMPEVALDELKRSGLLHYVAVSGGNVVLFLGVIWLLAGLFIRGPRTRAAIGLAAVIVFVLITRWEPSVVRAGLMVSLALAGRLFGVPVGGWTALSGAVIVALLVAPELVLDVGFQLSVLATSGLMLGAGWWRHRKPSLMWRSIGATVAAQLAVTPLLLVVFGTIPALSVVANVISAPLVSLATAVGWWGTVVDSRWLADAAAMLAGWVLAVSEWAAGLPQVGWSGVPLILLGVVMLHRRPAVAALLVGLALVLSNGSVAPVAGPSVSFLDVGQGDAVLIRSSAGTVVAIDTGPDPVVYAAALRRHGVDNIDLLVLTHSDNDHVGGIGALLDRVSVGSVWYPAFTDQERWGELLSGFSDTPQAIRAGVEIQTGDISIRALGPQRRYAADNDGSIVLWVEARQASLLLGGDIEAVAQADLPPVRPDILMVPHHGSKTTDVRWLAATVGPVAVLSFGEGNAFGHPAARVVDTLEAAQTLVLSTVDGDVTLSLADGIQLVSSAAIAQRLPKAQSRSALVYMT